MMSAPTHLPSPELIAAWPTFTEERPLRVLTSACLAGDLCGVDGTSYGEFPTIRRLLGLPNVLVVRFCPEHFSFGTPRSTPNVWGGDGFDVLAGRARVKIDNGDDWTDGILRAAERMADLATSERVHLAVLMDTSAACGSQVIYDGPRHLKVYRRGMGVCAARLVQAGVPIVSQRDDRALGRIFAKLGHPDLGPGAALDHHETDWYRAYFGV